MKVRKKESERKNEIGHMQMIESPKLSSKPSRMRLFGKRKNASINAQCTMHVDLSINNMNLLMTPAFLSSMVSSSEDISSINLGEYRPCSVTSSLTLTSMAVDFKNRSTFRIRNLTNWSHSGSSDRAADENSYGSWYTERTCSSGMRTILVLSFNEYDSLVKNSSKPDRALALKHSDRSPSKQTAFALAKYGSASVSVKLLIQLNKFLPSLVPLSALLPTPLPLPPLIDAALRLEPVSSSFLKTISLRTPRMHAIMKKLNNFIVNGRNVHCVKL